MPKWTLFLLLPLVAGCNGQPLEPMPANPAQTNRMARAGQAVRLALLPPSREGAGALATGTLTVEGPCLYLIGADGTRWLPGFMTFDTRWDGGALIVGGRRFVPGQRVALGGGEVKGAVARMAWVQAPDPVCDTSLIWVTVSINPA